MKSTIDRKIISINAQFLARPAAGIQRYAYQLIDAFDELFGLGEINAKKYGLELVAPRLTRTVMKYNSIPIRQVGKLQGPLWENIELPHYTHGKLLFNPCNTAPLFNSNQVISFHDISSFVAPRSYMHSPGILREVILSQLTSSARAVLVDSQFSKEELVDLCQIPLEKVLSVPLGCNHISQVQADYSVFPKYSIGGKPYLLVVGSRLPQDNMQLVLQAIASISRREFDVVIIGEGIRSIFPALKPTEGELKALYQEAIAAIFANRYAQSGMGPLESMTCGCPVICSELDPFQEVCKDSVLYFDPRSVQALADTICRMVNTPPLQRRLRWEGRWQADKYSWISTARKTWKILQQVLNFLN